MQLKPAPSCTASSFVSITAPWQSYINANTFHLHGIIELLMEGFDQVHVFLLLGLVVVVALHEEDAV